MNSKILCTGNPSVPGIAKHIKTLLPETVFLSRESGIDLLTDAGIDKFKEIIVDFDIFINHSQLPPTGQEKLLDVAATHWSTGHIISIGSVLEFDQFSWIDPVSAESKKRLKEKSLSLLSEKLKTTYIIVGGLQSNDRDQMRLDPARVAEIIKFVVDCEFNLPLIYVDNISDKLTDYWTKKKSMLV